MLCVVIVLAESIGRKKREDMKKISKEDQEHLLWTAEQIVKHMDKDGGHLQVIIHKRSESNLTWQYSVYLWYANDKGEIDKIWLNWFIATLEGTKLTSKDYVKGYGLGTERSFQVVYSLGHKLAKLLDWTEGPDRGYTYTNRVSGVF